MRGEAAAAEGEGMICEILGGGEGESNAISSRVRFGGGGLDDCPESIGSPDRGKVLTLVSACS